MTKSTGSVAMRDFKLNVLQFDPAYQNVADGIQNEKIRAVADAFVKNIKRVNSLANMPIGLWYRGSVRGQNCVLAYEQVMGLPFSFEGVARLSDEEDRRVGEHELALTHSVLDGLDTDE
jgi:hypothetical protein